jgi:Arm DNA-binding domain/Phage integrase, N-terminal SAM-like domain
MLRNAQVEALRPGETIWDAGKGSVLGFGARRQKSAVISYILKYTTRDGRQRWHTIGRHGQPWTVENAHTEALGVLTAVKLGGDPAGDRIAAKAAITVEELAERFFTEHVEPKRKPITARNYRNIYDKHIRQVLGHRRAREVTRQRVAELHHANHATPTQANRILALLSAMMTFAERQGERPDGSNPCRHVERFPDQKHERPLSDEDLGRLGKALAFDKGSRYALAAIRLLVFTGARLGEVLGLKWEWIDFERGVASRRQEWCQEPAPAAAGHESAARSATPGTLRPRCEARDHFRRSALAAHSQGSRDRGCAPSRSAT